MTCGNDALCISGELFLSMAIVLIVARIVGMVFKYFKQASIYSPLYLVYYEMRDSLMYSRNGFLRSEI